MTTPTKYPCDCKFIPDVWLDHIEREAPGLLSRDLISNDYHDKVMAFCEKVKQSSSSRSVGKAVREARRKLFDKTEESSGSRDVPATSAAPAAAPLYSRVTIVQQPAPAVASPTQSAVPQLAPAVIAIPPSASPTTSQAPPAVPLPYLHVFPQYIFAQGAALQPARETSPTASQAQPALQPVFHHAAPQTYFFVPSQPAAQPARDLPAAYQIYPQYLAAAPAWREELIYPVRVPPQKAAAPAPVREPAPDAAAAPAAASGTAPAKEPVTAAVSASPRVSQAAQPVIYQQRAYPLPWPQPQYPWHWPWPWHQSYPQPWPQPQPVPQQAPMPQPVPQQAPLPQSVPQPAPVPASTPVPDKQPKTVPVIRIFDCNQTEDIDNAQEIDQSNPPEEIAKEVQNVLKTINRLHNVLYDVYGRNSWDNKGGTYMNYLRYSKDMFNAFWDGARMVYGYPKTHFGDDGKLADMTDDSVIAHEEGHSMNSYKYEGASGAWEESKADINYFIFHHCVKGIEHPANADETDWMLGDALIPDDSQKESMRRADKPGFANKFDIQQLALINGKPHVYASVKNASNVNVVNDHGGVHIFSCIPTYVFYKTAIKFDEPIYGRMAKLWYAVCSDPKAKRDAGWQELATATVNKAKQLGYNDIADALAANWGEVGINVYNPSRSFADRQVVYPYVLQAAAPRAYYLNPANGQIKV